MWRGQVTSKVAQQNSCAEGHCLTSLFWTCSLSLVVEKSKQIDRVPNYTFHIKQVVFVSGTHTHTQTHTPTNHTDKTYCVSCLWMDCHRMNLSFGLSSWFVTYTQYTCLYLYVGEEARRLFCRSGLSRLDLGKIWALSDVNQDQKLDIEVLYSLQQGSEGS